MEKKRILIIEDEWKIRRLIKDFLVRERFLVDEAIDGEEGYKKYIDGNYDLIILDIMMPKLSGWKVCKLIREVDMIPIIMLTARGEVEDELRGFKLEADEYIKKPFNPKLLTARVNSLLRRVKKEEKEKRLKIDLDSRIVYLDGSSLDLTPMEFEFLEYLNINQNIALSREKIIVDVWGFEYEGDERTIDSHIRRLRKKLGKGFIHTVRGVGYRYKEE